MFCEARAWAFTKSAIDKKEDLMCFSLVRNVKRLELLGTCFEKLGLLPGNFIDRIKIEHLVVHREGLGIHVFLFKGDAQLEENSDVIGLQLPCPLEI